MHVYVLRGAPRSGKSTLARIYKKMFHGVAVVSADDYWTGPFGRYSYDFDFESEAHCFCFRKFLEAVSRENEVIVVDNTNSRLVEAAPYMLAASAHGYTPKIVTVLCPLKVMQARNEKNERGALPDGLIDTMEARIRQEEPPRWWARGEYDQKELNGLCAQFNIDPAHPEEVERRELRG